MRRCSAKLRSCVWNEKRLHGREPDPRPTRLDKAGIGIAWFFEFGDQAMSLSLWGERSLDRWPGRAREGVFTSTACFIVDAMQAGEIKTIS